MAHTLTQENKRVTVRSHQTRRHGANTNAVRLDGTAQSRELKYLNFSLENNIHFAFGVNAPQEHGIAAC